MPPIWWWPTSRSGRFRTGKDLRRRGGQPHLRPIALGGPSRGRCQLRPDLVKTDKHRTC